MNDRAGMPALHSGMTALRDRVSEIRDKAAGAKVWDLLPQRLRSLRFRLAVLYSVVLFGLAALVVGGLYLGVSATLRKQPVAQQVAIRRHMVDPFGNLRPVDIVLRDYQDFEREVNARTLDNLRRYSFGALLGLFATSIGVGWIISGRVLRPIDRITEVARDIQATDLSRRIKLDGPEDELKRLSDTFDGMLGRLDTAFSAQRQFVADASHELRNPLATIRTNLDLVADASDPDESARLVAAAQRAAERMSRLVGDLLVLAREGTPAALRESVDLSDVVRQVSEEFEGRGPAIERGVSFGIRVEADSDALKRALANLLDNAVRLAPEGSRIRVGAGERDGWAWIGVSDEGPGLTPAQAERVFDRFWRADDARSRAGGGAGLGLSIVRRIAESHGGEARVHSRDGGGSVFVIWLPAGGSGAPPQATPFE